MRAGGARGQLSGALHGHEHNRVLVEDIRVHEELRYDCIIHVLRLQLRHRSMELLQERPIEMLLYLLHGEDVVRRATRDISDHHLLLRHGCLLLP